MIQMSSTGSSVMEKRSVEIGCNNNVEIYVASSSEDIVGTYITKKQKNLEDKIVTGCSVMNNMMIVNIGHILQKSRIISNLLKDISNINIDIDMISIVEEYNQCYEFSFTINKIDFIEVESIIKNILDKGIEIKIKENISKISLTGIGIMTQSNILSDIIYLLYENDIDYKKLKTSEIDITIAIDSKDTKKAIDLITKKFNL